jgi:DNA-binding SARP family transcriptional activator
MTKPADDMTRSISVMGRLGVFPMMRLSLPGRRLLAYLALKGQPMPRGIAAAHLWPEMLDDAGRANLRRALWHVPAGWVETLGDELVLNATCDLAAAQAVASRALAGEAVSFNDITLLANDILPGWYEEWVLPEQEAFHLLRVQALEAICRSMLAAGQHALAIQAGAAAMAADPLRESAAEALIDAHLAQRNRYDAVQCFRSLARRLDEELGVQPDPALAERVVGLGRGG